MLLRRERPADVEQVRQVTTAAFRRDLESRLVDALRDDPAWLPALSLVAVEEDEVLGHVLLTRARVEDAQVVALGPLSVRPDRQRTGVGSALVHAVLGAADALDEPLVVLLGHPDYYPRFGFRPALELGVEPPEPAWGAAFQARPLTAYRAGLRGAFRYAQPFRDLDEGPPP